jgi:processive 1,2-diacylglycerol beta-glucosyltransferase
MPHVLILTASYGSGHNEAARNLAAAFEARGARVTTADHFREFVHPLFSRASEALYYATLRRAPVAWGAAYALGDWMASESPLTFGMTRLGATRLARRLAALAPDVVVTVHATPATAMSFLVERGVRVPPHISVVTDFVAHSQWIAKHVDRYCVAADEVQHEFVARGVPRDRVIVTGVPVREEFAEPLETAAAREALGLSRPGAAVVLAMAGSQGSLGRLEDVARALGRCRRPLQGILVAGRDEALRARLRAMTRDAPIQTLGYRTDVRRLMAAADLLVTKAGGMTLAEALAADLPILSYGSLAGQERRNERFASRVGVALVARSGGELARALERALDDPGLLERLRERIADVKRPDATDRVVRIALALAAVRS